ncbi:MAG: Gfo/Idh/MocA family oxidoreductase [Ignavibacteria bacterium]|nr:Gfo/Idh/MocA family oxidoreductase [Ignavibacteria bacterium]
MIQAIVKKGKVIGEEVPAPNVSENSLLIKVVNSCISPGTEMSGVAASGKSLIKKAMDQPEKIKKALDWMRNDGIEVFIKKYKSETEIGNATGYSLSGIVVGIGKGTIGFEIGDKVTAAGGGYACHAEYVDVPVNLINKIPGNVDFISASTVTIGAISLQGVRRADLKMGELAVVYGAGLIGLLTIQLLRNSGIRVAAVDLDKERLEQAIILGAEISVNPDDENAVSIIENWSDGFGVDAVIFTASTSSNQPISNSFKMCRRKGKVVLVGVSGMQINREDIYAKEIDFLISTSYGPGRYDKNYEEKGIDYPYPYVRWTENRNMREYLRQLSQGNIKVDKLVTEVLGTDRIEQAFNSFKNSNSKPLCVVLDYGLPDTNLIKSIKQEKEKIIVTNTGISKEKINIGFVGVGEFAKSIHLPNLLKLKNKFTLHAIMSKNGYKAKGFAELYKANYITGDYNVILNDKSVDLVMICTRHKNHGELVIKALKSGKNVFVEKPLAIKAEEIKQIEEFYSEGNEKKPLLMVGYNRRFSKYITEIKRHTEKRVNPLIINYRMNAGKLKDDHWVFDEGGRIIGETCHIIDLMTSLVGSEIASVNSENITPRTDNYKIEDNKVITLKYNDGSIAVISYFSTGSKDISKEYMEIHFDGKSIILDNYNFLKGYGLNIKEIKTAKSEKGHLEELIKLFDALKGENQPWPIELWDLLQTSKVTMLVAGI